MQAFAEREFRLALSRPVCAEYTGQLWSPFARTDVITKGARGRDLPRLGRELPLHKTVAHSESICDAHPMSIGEPSIASDRPLRTARVNFLLTDDEKSAILAAAQASGLTFSSFVRKSALLVAKRDLGALEALAARVEEGRAG